MNIILFILILVVLILVHEFGHFIVAKKSGIRVDEFGIGYPPRAFGKKFGETLYTLNFLPFGGFVRIFGENSDDESISGPDKDRSFINKPKYIQAMVLFAGVFFNILFAWILFSIIFMIGMPSSISENDIGKNYVKNTSVTITGLLPESPAVESGLLGGDKILSLTAIGDNDQKIKSIPGVDSVPLSTDDVSSFIAENSDYSGGISIKYNRDGQELTTIVNPEVGIISGEETLPAIGISMDLIGEIQYNPILAIWEGLKFTIMLTILIGVGIISFFANALTFSADLSEVAGPVGIVGIVGDASALGFVYLLNITAFISINLTIINLLPFPALDGGRLLFLLIEKIKGSPIRPTVANTANAIGFGLLILLMIVITYNDIARIFVG